MCTGVSIGDELAFGNGFYPDEYHLELSHHLTRLLKADYRMYQVKDFIQTADGLIFAVVHSALESGRVLVFLRYALIQDQWQKLSSEDANAYLRHHAPEYLWHSLLLDADLHAVPVLAIQQHYQPQKVLAELLLANSQDPVIQDLQQLCGMLVTKQIDLSHLGVTGSCLLGLQKHSSDLDLVCYQRPQFMQLRQALEELIAEAHCHNLSANDWLEAFQRRGCVDLSLDDYIWHEQRKLNKGVINQRKFDISLVNPSDENCHHYLKQLRQALEELIAEAHCHNLSANDWLEAFQRRGCVDLSLDDYIWHEQRKLNKGVINQRKFDISLVNPSDENCHHYLKLGHVKLTAKVIDDSAGFDYPAGFVIDDASVQEIVSFTATYTGQALAGETIVVAGQLEMDEQGNRRIVIGSSREAVGEYIRVVRV